MEMIKTILIEFWNTVGEMSPYLLFGFFMAGLLSMFISTTLVERHLGGGGFWSVLKASLLGIPLPLCSCSVIPVSMSLHKHHASRGATVSFLLSTPQTGVDSILVTYSLLGPVFAVFRPIAALITGVLGGSLTTLMTSGRGGPAEQAACHESCCCGGKRSSRIWSGLRYGFVTLPRDIGKPLMIGLVIAALVSVLIPDGFFAEKLGTGIFAKLAMMVLGIPVYVCATASVPVAAAMILKGLTPGAALVFLITGPATNAAGLLTIWKTLGRRAALAYLISVVLCSLGSGMILDSILARQSIEVTVGHMHMINPWLQHVSAVVLFLIMGWALISKKRHTTTQDDDKDCQ
jgi:uncharacterized membrane protein YraQ (UPF0718 family)